jgi:hypothetical protein
VDRSQPPEPLPRVATSHQVVAGDVPLEPPGFQPRTDLLAELDRPHALVPAVHFVTGPPGVGKTTLAAAYARAKLAAGWRLVAWVNAEDTLSLLAGLAKTADLTVLNEGGTGRDSSDPGQLLRRRLEADGDRCLLVFDDARDPDLLQPFVPAYGAARVLITGPARSSAIQGTSVPVDVFSRKEANAFLTARTGRVDSEGAGALAAELGHEPLALAQAASVIFEQSLGYRAYLEQLRAVPVDESLGREGGQPSVPGQVQAAALLSLGRAEAGDQTGVCTIVIEILAMLSAAGVRRDLLYAAGQAGALAAGGEQVAAALVDEALARLAELALVTISRDGQIILMHRSVMLVVRAEMARRQRLTAVCRLAASLLEAWVQALALFPDRQAVRDVPGQVSALVDNASGPAGEDKELAGAMLRLLTTAYWDVDRGPPDTPLAEAIPAAAEDSQQEEVLPDEKALPDEAAAPVEEVLQEEEHALDETAAPIEDAAPDEAARPVEAAELVEEPALDEEPTPDEEVRAVEEVPSAEAAPGPPSEASSDPEPEGSSPEPLVTSRVRSGARLSRLRRLHVLGLTGAMLILLAAGSGVALAISPPHAAPRPSGRTAAPAPGPVQLAAAWVSQQVSRSAIVACDPAMCAALQAQGVPPANLFVLKNSAASPLVAQVVVATPTVRSQFGQRLDSVYAPAVIASFGSGPAQVNVQVVAPNGATAYLAALRQDEAARQAAGVQLLANSHIAVAARARTQLAAGEVDSRLLILLPALAATHPVEVLAFGDPGPGAGPGVPWCSADLSGSGRAAGMSDASYLSWLTALVRAQILPFAGSVITLREGGQPVVRVEFSRPSPLGLLARGAT